MASKQEQAQQDQKTIVTQRQRKALNNAYATILADQATQTFLGFGFEEALDLQIEQIEGAQTAVRPNDLARATGILEQVTTAVEQLKSLPDEAFAKPKPDQDANSPENVA